MGNHNNHNNFINKLICGDNLDELPKLPLESVDLVYIDPPFFSNKKYEVVWGDEAEIRSFEDRWEGGIEVYIAWMKPRVELLKDILKPTGSFYLHCDWHANAHLRILLDEVFGEDNFQNEIIWHYRKWSTGKYCFQRNHDTILFYSRSQAKNRTFNEIHMEPAPSTLKRFGRETIVSGFDKDGKRLPSQTKHTKSKGPRRDDVWDIGRIPPIKQLFPTQKPPDLLKRIIEVSSKKDHVVLDAFCGCGTALMEAQKAGRKWIGIDISPTAVRLIESRLKSDLKLERDKDYTIIGMHKTIGELKKMKPIEFQNWVVNEMHGKHSQRFVRDFGIDGMLARDLYREEAGIQVKQSPDVGRNVVDNFKAALERKKLKKGYIVAFSFTKDAKEESARLNNEGQITIELVEVENLLYKTKPLG